MPCRDGRDEPGYDNGYAVGRSEREQLVNQLALVSAIACAAITALKGVKKFADIDWDESGVSQDAAVEWWLAHKKKDEARRKREAAEKQRVESTNLLKKKLRDTFSPEEIALLVKEGGL